MTFSFQDAQLVSIISESGAFRAAAAKLGIAPSAVSARVAHLERVLKVTLFDRSRRGAELTPAGRRFLDQAERLLTLRDGIVQDLAAADDGLVGVLRIGVSETIVHTSLPCLLSRLAEAAPRVSIELSVDMSERLAQALIDGDLDIAVLMRQWAPRDLPSTPQQKVAIGWYAAPELVAKTPSLRHAMHGATLPPQRPRGPVGRDVFKDLAVITFSKGTPPAREVARLLDDPRQAPPPIHGSSALASILHLTAAGYGVGTLPVAMANAECAVGRLTRLDFGSALTLSPLQFDICWAARGGRRFVDILTANA